MYGSATGPTSGSAPSCVATSRTSRSARRRRSRTTPSSTARIELPTIIGRRVTLGHGALVEGCVIEDHALIGMGAIVLHHAHVGEGAMLAAGTVLHRARFRAGGDADRRRSRTAEEGDDGRRRSLAADGGRRTTSSCASLYRDNERRARARRDDNPSRGDVMEAAMLIGGEWRQAAVSEELEVVNPATEEVVGERTERLERRGRRARRRDRHASASPSGRRPTSRSAPRSSAPGRRPDRAERQGAWRRR